ncbi:unnamed protein product [Bubo scandiacus]
MNSDSSSVSSRASSPDMDEMYLRDHHHHHHHHHHQDSRLSSVSSTQNDLVQKMSGEGLSRNGSKAGGEGSKYKIKKQLSEQDLQQLRHEDQRPGGVHPILGSALSSANTSSSLSALPCPAIGTIRPPHSLLKTPSTPPPCSSAAASSFTGRACRAPCTITPDAPPPHLSALTASNMARISGETKDLLK